MGLRRYKAFCRQACLTPIPLVEATVCRFTAYLYSSRLSSSTIRLYLSSIRFYQIAGGFGNVPLDTFSHLHYVLRGVARNQPINGRPARLPITVDVLHLLFCVWDRSPPRYEWTMLWAACTLGFFAFLQSGEFTVTQDWGGPRLTLADIQVDSRSNPTYLTVTLWNSKTDPFGQGCTSYVGRSRSLVCPVVALLAYLAVRPLAPGPLFIHADGSPLTRSQLVASVRTTLQHMGMDTSCFSGHSFRIGAATAAAQAGLPDSLIQTLGRWKSAAFLRYIRTPTNTLLNVSRALLQGQVATDNHQ